MKVGVLGNGSIGSRHARNLRLLGHEVLIYDPNTERDVQSEQDLYRECTAIVIATPTIYHKGAIAACAERGLHFLVEKPLARSTRGMGEFIDLAAINGASVMIGTNLRFHPCVQQAKRWIDEGEIGPPVWSSFTCGAKSIHPGYLGDGVILNTGAHEVDMALFLFGPAKVLTAHAHCTDGHDDIADFLLEHDETGVRSLFHLDHVTPSEIREAWIVGEKSKIGLELRNRNASLGSRTTAFEGSFDTDYLNEMKSWIDRIEGRDSLGATGADGLLALSVLVEVREKAGLE